MLNTDEPLVSTTEQYGTTYRIAYSTWNEVLQGIGTVRITVIAPSGNKLFNNVDGTNLLFQLTEYGYYKVQYIATDAIGQRSTKEIKVRVKDETQPELNVNGSYKAMYTRGTDVIVLDGKVENRSDAEIRILVKKPDMKNVLVESGTRFTLDMIGKYEIVYLVYDSSNRITRTAYTFEVK
jgi:hypothetical protein